MMLLSISSSATLIPNTTSSESPSFSAKRATRSGIRDRSRILLRIDVSTVLRTLAPPDAPDAIGNSMSSQHNAPLVTIVAPVELPPRPPVVLIVGLPLSFAVHHRHQRLANGAAVDTLARVVDRPSLAEDRVERRLL